MSSKLVRKSLELVCGKTEAAKKRKTSKNAQYGFPHGVQGLGKINKTRKDHKRKLENFKQERRKKRKDEKKDFTEQNLEYLTNTSWKLEEKVYETIIKQCQGKKAEHQEQCEVSFVEESDHD